MDRRGVVLALAWALALGFEDDDTWDDKYKWHDDDDEVQQCFAKVSCLGTILGCDADCGNCWGPRVE